jgi:integrase
MLSWEAAPVALDVIYITFVRVLKWTAPRASGQVDRRCVVNPRQARALLAAVRAQQPSGPRLVAFFGLMYYAGLRPEEAVSLTADCLTLPPPAQADDWGELHLRNATPDAGRDWTDDGSARERRQLKHRAEGDSRIVPAHPELALLLRDHLAQFGVADDGRLFSGVRGGELATVTYRRAWVKARQDALTAAEQASPLARRPYDLRHACLSTWLNGGVYPTSRGVGRAQRGCPAADLRQVRRRPGRAGQAPDRRSTPPGLTRHLPRHRRSFLRRGAGLLGRPLRIFNFGTHLAQRPA